MVLLVSERADSRNGDSTSEVVMSDVAGKLQGLDRWVVHSMVDTLKEGRQVRGIDNGRISIGYSPITGSRGIRGLTTALTLRTGLLWRLTLVVA